LDTGNQSGPTGSCTVERYTGNQSGPAGHCTVELDTGNQSGPTGQCTVGYCLLSQALQAPVQ
jgi:hypothetical protein